MKNCEVCSITEHKYKCPSCGTFYCSLDCYKTHKERCEEIREARVNHFKIDTQPTLSHPTGLFIEDESEVEIPPETLAKLEQNKELNNLLHNPHLRNFLAKVNNSANPKSFMNFAMREPVFVEFAEECLKVVNPDCQKEEPTDEQIVEYIREELEN